MNISIQTFLIGLAIVGGMILCSYIKFGLPSQTTKKYLEKLSKKYDMPAQEIKKYFAGARIIKRNECIIDAKKYIMDETNLTIDSLNAKLDIILPVHKSLYGFENDKGKQKVIVEILQQDILNIKSI